MIVASFEMLISSQNKIWHAYSLFNDQKVQAKKLLNERKGRALLMKKIVHPHLVDSRAEEGEGSSQENVPPLPAPPKGLSRPCQWKVVDTIGEQYEEAVSFFFFFWGTLFSKKLDLKKRWVVHSLFLWRELGGFWNRTEEREVCVRREHQDCVWLCWKVLIKKKVFFFQTMFFILEKKNFFSCFFFQFFFSNFFYIRLFYF